VAAIRRKPKYGCANRLAIIDYTFLIWKNFKSGATKEISNFAQIVTI